MPGKGGFSEQDGLRRIQCNCAFSNLRNRCSCESLGCYERNPIGGIPCPYCSCRAKPDPLEALVVEQILIQRRTQSRMQSKEARMMLDRHIEKLYERIKVIRKPKTIAAQIARRLIS